MTSRDRVLAALDHREPDRVPIDLSGHRSSGIAAIVYPKLRELLGLPPRTIRVYDPIQQLAIVDEDVLDRFGVDTIEMGRGFAHEESAWADWTLPDGTPCKMPAWALPERRDGEWVFRSATGRVIGRMPDGALFFEQCHWPFLEHDDLAHLSDAFAESMWTALRSPPGRSRPEHGRPGGGSQAAARAHQPRDHRPLRRQSPGNRPVPLPQRQFPDASGRRARAAHAFLDKLVEHHLANLERFLGAVGPYIDIILFGDDLGMQTGPQMSPAMYREFFKPRHAVMWRRAKELARVKVMLHCCGGVRTLLPDLIDAGLDAINPVQISCRGMNAAELKREFGKDLTFWGGGCDTRQILPDGSPEQVRAHVKEQVKVLAPGGGFVFQQVHNIMANVPAANIVAMYDAVQDH